MKFLAVNRPNVFVIGLFACGRQSYIQYKNKNTILQENTEIPEHNIRQNIIPPLQEPYSPIKA